MKYDGTWDDGIDYVAYPFVCEWEGDIPPQSDVKIITNMGVKTLPKDFRFPITSISTSDYDKGGLTDWQEVDYDVLGKGVFYINKSDLPLYLEYIFSRKFFIENPLKRVTKDSYINNQLLQVKFLPIITDPTNKDSDGDQLWDNEDPEPLKYMYINGISYILYRPNDADYREGFTVHMENLRKTLMEKYKYKSIDQVVVKPVRTEYDFCKAWESMHATRTKKKIDNVSLIFHGKFYGLIIDAKKYENLTTNPAGKTKSDKEATRIHELVPKDIKQIDIISCNTGLVDAIDGEINVPYNDNSGRVLPVNGNVAQNFLQYQNVDEVYAFDGSVTPNGDTGEAELSWKQHLEEALAEIGDQSKHPYVRKMKLEDINFADMDDYARVGVRIHGLLVNYETGQIIQFEDYNKRGEKQKEWLELLEQY